MKKQPKAVSENSIARKALEHIAAIEEQAKKDKEAQLGTLRDALETIRGRVTDLLHQEQQLLDTIAKITGKAPTRKKRTPKADLSELRERIGRWISGRGGEKFSAGDLKEHFPELADVGVVGVFLKPLIEAGTLTKEGDKAATRYFAGEII